MIIIRFHVKSVTPPPEHGCRETIQDFDPTVQHLHRAPFRLSLRLSRGPTSRKGKPMISFRASSTLGKFASVRAGCPSIVKTCSMGLAVVLTVAGNGEAKSTRAIAITTADSSRCTVRQHKPHVVVLVRAVHNLSGHG